MKIDKVSIVMAAFNEEFYVERCIEAILSQAYSFFELIIVDDASSDNTPGIIKGIKDHRIKYVRNNTRKGISFSRNAGIHVSRTEYIFFTDGDCLSDKYWLQEGVSLFERSSCCGIEGKTYYETSRTTITDKIIENTKGGGLYDLQYGV